MARWEPDARGRLLRAAIDLFAEQGYDRTTTAQIAARAGLTKTTFFRHFTDKREVLFYGQPMLIDAATSAIAAAPSSVSALVAVASAVDAMASAHRDKQREYAPQLGALVAANEELRERGIFKRASIAAATASALRDRGFPEPGAGLAAELGVRAYYTAFDRWIAPDNVRSMPELAAEALHELRVAVSALD